MSTAKRSRRHFTTEQKVAILKRHMVDKVPVSASRSSRQRRVSTARGGLGLGSRRAACWNVHSGQRVERNLGTLSSLHSDR